MNLQYLRYAIEVDRAGSISKAAENLYMNQPNLSKAIKELEATMGVSLFTRSTKGISATTEDGRVFIEYAKNILAQVEEMESHFQPSKTDSFRAALPRGGYVSEAMAGFAIGLQGGEGFDIRFIEGNSLQAIQSVAYDGYHLGVVRYCVAHEKYFRSLLKERELEVQEILTADAVVIMHHSSILSHKTMLALSDLEGRIELVTDDFMVPGYLPPHKPEKLEAPPGSRRFFISERESQWSLLARIPGAFLWSCPMPKEALAQNGLVQKRCSAKNMGFKDILIYRQGHVFGELERFFLEKLDQAKALIDLGQ